MLIYRYIISYIAHYLYVRLAPTAHLVLFDKISDDEPTLYLETLEQVETFALKETVQH